MTTSGRKKLLCQQTSLELTGIDFVWVDPSDHRRLAVFFVIEPDRLVRPFDPDRAEITVTLAGTENPETIEVSSTAWNTRPDASGNPRLTLTVTARREGSFQNYRLALTDTPADAGPNRLDPFSREILFSFKQPCPSPFDCQPRGECPPPESDDYPVDYLARDFESFRQALLTFASDRYPDWQAQVPADFGGMISELFSALGDEFSYIQDRFLREGFLDTLTQRRSFAQLARLIDYRLDPGESSSGPVILRLYDGERRPSGTTPQVVDVPSGARVWADQEDSDSIPYEVGQDLEAMIAGTPTHPAHSHWTDLPAYVADPDRPCLSPGARELHLADDGLLAPPFPAAVLATDIRGYWEGKQLLLETRPSDPETPVRRHLLTLDRPVESFVDPLTGTGPILTLHWREEDALPFPIDLTETFVSANLVPVRAGLTRFEDFEIGEPSTPQRGRTIERGGPLDLRSSHRPPIHRYSLGATVGDGLGWRSIDNPAGDPSSLPDIVLDQLDPAAGLAPLQTWKAGGDPLEFSPTDERVSVENGHWGKIASYQRAKRAIEAFDFLGDQGYTLRFGDGTFGRRPTRGDVFRVWFRTGPGASGNVPEETIRRVRELPNFSPAPLQSMPFAIRSVRNPLRLGNGRDPEDLELARRIAPAAYKSVVLRAVRNRDYRDQIERLPDVDRANAVTRWTGAWASTFVAADPVGTFELSDDLFETVQARLGAVRQVGRCALARQPVYLPVDLKIAICVEDGASFGNTVAGILRALSPANGPSAFFAPDRFTFGEPLVRASLEAAIACIDGVRAVLEIQARIRGRTEWGVFSEREIPVAADRILIVKNDPDRPGRGSIRIYEGEIPEEEAS